MLGVNAEFFLIGLLGRILAGCLRVVWPSLRHENGLKADEGMHHGGETPTLSDLQGLLCQPHPGRGNLPAGLLCFLGSDKIAAGSIFLAVIWNSCWDLIVHLEELPGIATGITKWECISISQANV